MPHSSPITIAMTSSSSSSHPYKWKYDVFISFRGPDTRLGFTGHLYDALCRNKLTVFFDDEELEKGEEINPALDKAIRQSRIVLVIFSKDYASSTWCLEELAKVMEYSSNDKAKGMFVLPVFYQVKPSDLRHEKGIYAEALAKHEARFIERGKIDRWRLALSKAADLSGWHFMPGQMYEHKFIGNIVQFVSKRISSLLNGDKSIGQRDSVRLEKEQEEKELMRKEKAETHLNTTICNSDKNDKDISQHSSIMDKMKERRILPGTEDRIVVYCTSVRVIRKTYDDCSKVRMILNGSGVAVVVDERDIHLHPSYRKELQNALGCTKEVPLPQVFIRGKYVGNAEEIERLNESGVLEKLLKGSPIQDPGCDNCGDARFVPCSNCSGSWKVKRCIYCNENGLIRCPRCCS